MKKEGEEYRIAGESATPDLKLRRGVKEGTTYQFMVRLVDEDNYESPPSNEITATSLKKGEAPALKEDEAKKEEKPEPKKEEKFSLGIGPFGSAGVGHAVLERHNRDALERGRRDHDRHRPRAGHAYQLPDHGQLRAELRLPVFEAALPVQPAGQRRGYTAEIYQTTYYKSKEMVKPFSFDLASAIGFGVVRTPLVRFWLGPEYFLKLITTGSKRYLGLSAGLGLVLGLNINIGSLVTLAFSGSGRVMYSYRYSEYGSIDTSDFVQGSFVPAIPAYVQPDPRTKLHQQDHGIGFGGQLNIAVLFRINDTYSPKAK